MLRIPTNVVSVQPTIEPVTVSDVKANAYIVDTADDNYLISSQFIPAARKFVERLANRSLITQTRIQYYDCFPDTPIWLRFSPVQSVSSFTYTDANEISQTLSSALYELDIKRIPARINVGYDDTWPTDIEKTNAVAITYVAGYGAAVTDVPIIYRQAIIRLCTHWYNNRDIGCTVPDELLTSVQNIIAIEGATYEYI